MDKDWKKRLGVVYSTRPDFEYEKEKEEEQETLPPASQKLYISLDRKNRKGKGVTLVEGFAGSTDALEELGRFLKGKCGVGGTVKDGVILVQGDFRDRVSQLLEASGYRVKRKGG
jgi:translation initiation factor 1